MKIRVLHCIETIASGGVEQVRLTMIKGLDKDKFEHKIICTWEGGAVADALKAEGVELIAIGGFRHPFQWSKHRQVLRVIKRFKPHIIHGAIFEGMSMAAFGGKLGKVPIIILEETSHPLSRSKKAIYLQQLFAKVADKVIGIAPSVVKYLQESVGLSASKVLLINNGVNNPREVNLEEKNKIKLKLGVLADDVIIGSV
ncbi:glycosyltransferase, partial [Aquiflexum sp.]|uniref:glycosyltransferase n=1 Tax=Aquiflexum sp. TaxID=1872584 RepID=UPI003593BC16